MIDKKHRLINHTDFQHVFENGKYAREKDLSIKFLKNNLKITRIGIAVGSKAISESTKRNNVKRILRAVFSKHLPNITPGWDIIAIYNKEKIDFSTTYPQAEKILKNNNLLTKK